MSGPMHRALARLTAQTALNADEVEALLAVSGRDEHVRAGAEFVRRDHEVSTICIIVEGLAARTVADSNGLRQITAFYVPGDMPDILSLMQPRVTSSLEAVSECQLFRVPHGQLASLLSRFPALMEAFWRYTVWDDIVATEWVVNVGKRPGPQRIAHLLCELGVRLGKDEMDLVSFPLPLTQSVLGEASGLSAVHVNRCLQGLRRKGLIQFEKGELTIPDWQKMTEEAGFDDGYLKPERPLRLLGSPAAIAN
jgi:CRP-like cAMP-binding protein